MNYADSWLSLLPSMLAIVFAIITRKILLALIGGIVLGYAMLNSYGIADTVLGSLAGMEKTLWDAGNIKIVLFTLVIGALFGVLEKSNSFHALVYWLESRSFVASKRGAKLLTWLMGVIIFIESNITIMLAGATSRPLYDKFKISREKLAYIIDSTSAPICILIPLNAWGAYNLALLNKQEVNNALQVFVESLMFNFYAIISVVIAFIVAYFDWNLGAMKHYEAKVAATNTEQNTSSVAQSHHSDTGGVTIAVLSLLSLLIIVPLVLYITGDGNMMQGSGGTSVLMAVSISFILAGSLSLLFKKLSFSQLLRHASRGVVTIFPIAAVLVLAITLGDLTKLLGTGQFVSSLMNQEFPTYALLSVLFILSALTAFSIGSSWGTFALMIPLAVPLAAVTGLPVAPFIAAAISGGIFGDHSSPISDTTIMASVAAGTEHIAHVKTQLPYALLAGVFTVFCYLGLGFWVTA